MIFAIVDVDVGRAVCGVRCPSLVSVSLVYSSGDGCAAAVVVAG